LPAGGCPSCATPECLRTQRFSIALPQAHCPSRSMEGMFFLFNQEFLRNQPTYALTSNGAQSAAPSAASKGRPRSFPSAKLSTLIGAKQLKSLTSLRSSGQIHFNPGPDTFQGSTVCAFESVNPSCDSWLPSVYGPANVACREDHFTKPGQGVPAFCCVGASYLVRTNYYSDVPKTKPLYVQSLHYCLIDY
jgi:hypothetical protein